VWLFSLLKYDIGIVFPKQSQELQKVWSLQSAFAPKEDYFRNSLLKKEAPNGS